MKNNRQSAVILPLKTVPERNAFTVWRHKPFKRMPSEQMKPKFMKGLDLNRVFYHEVIKPLMKEYFPGLPYSAALNGHGSDVIGFDSPTSIDHNWGPHLNIFLKYSDYLTWAPRIDEMLRKCLPYTFKGFSTNFTENNPDLYLKQVQKYITKGDVNHLCGIFSIRGFLNHYLHFDRDQEIGLYDWLTFPEQNLVEVTAGEIYHDGLGELQKMRQLFQYYPHDVWLYALRVQWGKIANELQFHARTGEEGDELGSRIMAGRMVEKIIKMCFLMERKYAPYLKWLGSSFKQLRSSKKLLLPLLKMEQSPNWKVRQEYTFKAYQLLGAMHNSLGITRRIPVKAEKFPGRSYKVLDVSIFIKEIEKMIKDEKLRNMKFILGRIDQFIDHAKIGHENYVFRHMQDLIE